LEQDSPFLQERTNKMSCARSARPAQAVAGLARRGERPKSGLGTGDDPVLRRDLVSQNLCRGNASGVS
jgi:hypothetical protein